MCGIFGCVNQQNLKGADLIRVSETLKHRGPDDEGFLSWEGGRARPYSGPDSKVKSTPLQSDFPVRNALVHRRLSILDLSAKGHQPMSLNDRNIHIVFNGEIYNFQKLAREHNLELQSGSDTEVILRLYEKFGIECFGLFRGMWALAILDLKKNKLILSRDRFGIKPLHYRSSEMSFAFCSEIKPLLSLNKNESPEISTDSMLEYVVFGASNDPNETFFKGINSLKPGCSLSIDLTTLACEERSYYDLEEAVNSKNGRSKEKFEDLFMESIREHIISDVDVGSCLSGGLDSSLIVSQAAKAYKGTFRTYTCSFPGSDIDESRFARILGEKYSRVQQHFTNPRGPEFLNSIEHLIDIHERPIGSASIFAQYAVMKLASENGAKVLLDGQGADEVLGGYYPFAGAYLLGLMKSGNIPGFLNAYRQLKNNFNPHMQKAMLRAGYYDLPAKAQLKARQKARLGFDLLTPDYQEYVQKLSPPSRGDSNFKKLGLKSIQYGLYELLQYEDRNAMAFSIETRVPFLDHRLVEWALTQKPSRLITKGWTKYPIRQILEKESLPKIAWRKDKLGFVAPQEKWMKESSRELNELIESREIPGIFDQKKVRALMHKPLTENEHLSEFWRLLSLVIWKEKFKVALK